jgi:hypothetical protein
LLSELNLEENSFHLRDTFFQWGSDSRIKLGASFDQKVNPRSVKLNLESNRINEIDANAFALGLECLEELNLKRNQLVHLEASVFESVNKLKVINLSKDLSIE